MKITNDNEFLGFLISKMDENHECDQNECYMESGLDANSYNYYMNMLKAKGFVVPSMSVASITEIGLSSYIPRSEEILTSVNHSAKLTLKFFLGIISSVIVAVASAFIVWYFGFQ